MPELIFDELKKEILGFTKESFKDFKGDAKKDIEKFIEDNKEDIEKWGKGIINKEITESQLKSLILQRKKVLEALLEKHKLQLKFKAGDLAEKLLIFILKRLIALI